MTVVDMSMVYGYVTKEKSHFFPFMLGDKAAEWPFPMHLKITLDAYISLSVSLSSVPPSQMDCGA